MEAYWIIVSKNFIKCSHCGYEIFVGGRHTAPRECRSCGCKMIKVVKENDIIKTDIREGLHYFSEKYTPKECCINRLEEK